LYGHNFVCLNWAIRFINFTPFSFHRFSLNFLFPGGFSLHFSQLFVLPVSMFRSLCFINGHVLSTFMYVCLLLMVPTSTKHFLVILPNFVRPLWQCQIRALLVCVYSQIVSPNVAKVTATVLRTQRPRNRVRISGLNMGVFSFIQRHTGSSHCATSGVSTRQTCQGLNLISHFHPLPSFRMCRSLSSAPYMLSWRQKEQISFTIRRILELIWNYFIKRISNYYCAYICFRGVKTNKFPLPYEEL